MARIGVRWPVYNTYTVTQNADGTETESDGVGKVFGKAIAEDISITAESVIQYANDGEAEVSAPFTGGTIKSELNDITDTAEAEACGHTITEDGELIANSDNEAPYMRRGFVVPILVDNVKKYMGRVYPRVKYAPPSENFATKGKTLAFTGVTMQGTIMRNANGDWKWQKIFATEAEALAYVHTKCHMPSSHDALSVTSVPANNATGVAVDANIVITFNNPIDHGDAPFIKTSDSSIIAAAKTFNGAKTILTINPTADLSASTQYAVLLSGMTDAYGQTLADTVIKFTTAS